MATTVSPSSNSPSRPTYSCIRCADRKVKCDRQKPCSACVKHNADCIFNPSQPPRKRRKRVKEQILTDRLRHYEVLLQARGVDPSKLPDTPLSEPRSGPSYPASVVLGSNDLQSQTPTSIESEPNRVVSKTQLVHDQGRYQFVDNSLWTRVVEEYHDPEDALEGSFDDASDLEASDDDFGYVLNSQPKYSTRSRHPPADRIHQLWQIFIENVDPLTKVVHVPTLRAAVEKAASNIEAIPRSFEALIFAIYSAAVMSLKDGECKQRLGEPRRALLLQYISGTKTALSQAKFMRTNSIVVLQALVLHLLSVRDIYEPRAVWSLTGVAVRIAQGMGLERDGDFLGLPQFETEMRRRIWWLLKTHDFRTAELCGFTKFRDLDTGIESTKGPTNINDDQLYPGMVSLAAESNTLTDVAFVALKYELANFTASRIAKFRQQGKNSSQQEPHAPGSHNVDTDDAFEEIKEILETKYLRYCDPSQPLHLMVMLTARISINVVRFLTHHPRRWASIEQTPLSERERVWELSIKLLEQHNMAQSNPQLRQFAWHSSYFQQWHAFIHVLDTLRANPLRTDAEKAWLLIGNIYKNTPDMVFDTKKPIHIAVGNLCLKAYSDREAALHNGSLYPTPAPEFILKLRQQREVAKAKRQTRGAKSSQAEHQVSPGQANARDQGPRPDASVVSVGDSLDSTHLPQATMPDPPGFTQAGSTTDGDPFWLMNGFDDSQIGNSDNFVDMDLDFMLPQDQNVEDAANQNIPWEQWDAWLADSNAMRPLSSEWDFGAGA